MMNLASPQKTMLPTGSEHRFSPVDGLVRPHSSVAIPAASARPTTLPSHFRVALITFLFVGHHDPEDLWSNQDPAPALDGSQALRLDDR